MRKVLLFAYLCALFGCTMHPKYERPKVEEPTAWRVETNDSTPEINIAWWKQLGDDTLNQYIEEALKNNQNLQEAIFKVDQYIARLGIVQSELYPQIQANIGADRMKLSSTLQSNPLRSISAFDAYSLVVNAAYELDIWGKIRSASQQAKAQLMAQIQNRRTVVLTIVSAVTSQYIDLLMLDKKLFIALETLATREESYYLAKVRFELGLTSLIQVEQARSEMESAEVAIVDLEREIGLKEDLLSILLGKPPADIKRGKYLDQLKMIERVSTAMPSELLNQRPDILAAEEELIAANANIGVAKAKFFPQISLTGALGTESSQFNNLFTNNANVWQYGASLLQEVFTGGKLTSGLKLSHAQKSTLLHTYEQTILNAFKEVNDALINHQKYLEEVIIQEERVLTFREYLHLATLRYNDGQTDYLTFLDAERRFFNAQLDLAAAQGDSFTSLVAIYKSLGGGWVLQADKIALDEGKSKEH
ncbi:MAG: efflux transporter outer membrane subunit [Rhabdochlamydiaceae bacterium]|nr:efflux transporter outer membrane subunit [Candidatus Amphrikana amoebophyrae]